MDEQERICDELAQWGVRFDGYKITYPSDVKVTVDPEGITFEKTNLVDI